MSAPLRDSSDFTWEIINDEADLDRLEPEWSALNAKCGPEGFFTRLEVIRANWARHRGDPGKSLHIAVFRQAGDLVLCAPMVKVREPIGTHKLHWLDSKTPLFDDALLDPDVEIENVARQFAEFLSSSWLGRVLKIGFVLEGSALHRLLNAAGTPVKFRTVASSLSVSEYDDWDHYLSKMPAKRRNHIRYYGRKMAKAGANPVQHVTDPSERRKETARLFAQKRLWVEARNDIPDWIVPEESEIWFQYVAEREDSENKTHIMRICSDTDWIARILFFERNRTLFLSKLAHNPLWEKYSPGWLMVQEVLRYAIEQRMDKVELMIGQANWKDRICDEVRPVHICRAGLMPWRRLRWRNPLGQRPKSPRSNDQT